jgi:hypothetical protein
MVVLEDHGIGLDQRPKGLEENAGPCEKRQILLMFGCQLQPKAVAVKQPMTFCWRMAALDGHGIGVDQRPRGLVKNVVEGPQNA